MVTSKRTTVRLLARRHWPWIVLALVVVPAAWHILDFDSGADGEYPLVVRPTFSAYPPAAYRLAEPGDTIDRVGLYMAAGATALAVGGWLLSRSRREPTGAWSAATALGLAAVWYAATPGPTPDGWYGLGWRSILDPSAPGSVRAGLLAGALALAAAVLVSLRRAWPDRARLWRRGRERGAVGLLLASVVLVALRQVDPPGIGPAGYWPRWAFAWGMAAFVLALVRCLPPLPEARPRRRAWGAGVAAGVVLLIAGGLAIDWYHRPVSRLKVAVPGKVFTSAMPTYRGLEVAHRRHGFKTIVNLFPEHTDQRSPHFPDEVRFAREHGITYVLSPEDDSEADAFLDRTLAIARDPDAWPVLVHCHGNMDRTPAWLGIYRYLVQGRPLDEVVREIEQHRGSRPKASVTLLYNHALARLAPDRYARDPVGQLLIRNAAAAPNPYDGRRGGEPAGGVSRRTGEDVERR